MSSRDLFIARAGLLRRKVPNPIPQRTWTYNSHTGPDAYQVVVAVLYDAARTKGRPECVALDHAEFSAWHELHKALRSHDCDSDNVVLTLIDIRCGGCIRQSYGQLWTDAKY